MDEVGKTVYVSMKGSPCVHEVTTGCDGRVEFVSDPRCDSHIQPGSVRAITGLREGECLRVTFSEPSRGGGSREVRQSVGQVTRVSDRMPVRLAKARQQYRPRRPVIIRSRTRSFLD